MGGACGTYGEEICTEGFEESTPLERRALRWKDMTIIVERHTMRCGLDSSGPLQGQVAGSCEYGNGPSGSKTRGERLEQLRNC